MKTENPKDFVGADKVTISRLWNRPSIHVKVNMRRDSGIEIEMGLDDFIAALKQEIGSVRWIVRQQTFETRVSGAVERILSGVKKEAKKVVR